MIAPRLEDAIEEVHDRLFKVATWLGKPNDDPRRRRRLVLEAIRQLLVQALDQRIVFRGYDLPEGDYQHDFVAMYRFVDGKIVERWAVHDDLAMIEQLGGIPSR